MAEHDYTECTSVVMSTILEYPSECKSWFYTNGVTKPNYPVPATFANAVIASQYHDMAVCLKHNLGFAFQLAIIEDVRDAINQRV